MMGQPDPNFTVDAPDCPNGIMQAFIPNGAYTIYLLAESIGMTDSPFGPAIEVHNAKIEIMFSVS